MQVHDTEKIRVRGRRRLGQGHGSGRVKTSGRGTKGQNARNKVPISFEGGALSLIKRLPFRRGKDRNHSIKPEQEVISVGMLNSFAKGSEVTVESLLKQKMISGNSVKVLGGGELTVALNVKLPVTKSAREKIVNAGGQIVE